MRGFGRFLLDKKVAIFFGALEFAVFLWLYNAFEIAVAWVFVFGISAVFCIANFGDAVIQRRVQRRLMQNSAVGAVTENAVEQEGIRLAMSVLWLMAGVAALLEIDSQFAVWVLFAGAYAFRANALLTLKLRREIEELSKSE